MKKLLTATVSWQRPELCEKMINSFLKTRKLADLFVYICEDDPRLEGYKQIIKKFPKVTFEIGPHLFIAEVSNYILKFDYEYYQMVNDDHEFIEAGWDEDMINGLDKVGGWRLAASYMPKEMMKGGCDNNPTAEIFSKKITDALGYYNYTGFKQYGCDKYIKDLGEALGGILQFSGKILHNCWHGINRMEKDKTAEFIYSSGNMAQGNNVIAEWELEAPGIIKRVLAAKKEDEKR